MLRLLIPETLYYVFGRPSQTKVVDKFLFNTLPAIMRSPKLKYWELLLCYGFVRSFMPQELVDCLYNNTPGALMVEIKDEKNRN